MENEPFDFLTYINDLASSSFNAEQLAEAKQNLRDALEFKIIDANTYTIISSGLNNAALVEESLQTDSATDQP